MQFCSSDTTEIGILGNFCFPLFEEILCSLVLTFFVRKVGQKAEKNRKIKLMTSSRATKNARIMLMTSRQTDDHN